MKKNSKQKAKDSSQSIYMKVLSSLRSSVSLDYSKALRRETRGIILGYD